MKIKILYEDKNVLVIDKPAGLAVHGDAHESSTKEKFLTDWILKNYPRMKNVGEPMGEIPRPGIVHRLDKDTSGVLILAKNQATYEFLKKQFMDRTIRKLYVAIVCGHFKNQEGMINKPIGRSPTDFRKYLSGRGARGELREAITYYRVLKEFKQGTKEFAYVELLPKTGRTHQLRVHLKYLNHPIAGDSLYDPKGPKPKGLARMALHAKSIEFQLPPGKTEGSMGATIKVESKIPKAIESLIK